MAETTAVPAAEQAADDGMEAFERMLDRVRAAQKAYSTFSQEKVDSIFKTAALAANRARESRWPRWPWPRRAWASSRTR